MQDDQSFRTFGIADGDDALAVVKPPREAISAGVRLAELLHGALPVAQCRDLPARRQGQHMPLRVRRVGFEIFRRIDEPPVPLRPRTMALDFYLPALVLTRIEDEQVRPGVVHDALSVGAGAAGIEVPVVGVLAQPLTIAIARIEVADAIMVGDKVDALADPHRAAERPARV